MRLISKSSMDIKTLFDTAKTLIINAEGFSPIWYQDSFGNETIGYGFKAGGMANSLNIYKDKIMPISAANKILDKIITELMVDLNARFPFFDNLPINEGAVLMDMAYNLGLSQLSDFSAFLGYLKAGYIDLAVADLTTTLWYNQVKNRAVRDCFNLFAQVGNLYLI